jgi:PAS domain S-box-containing protein
VYTNPALTRLTGLDRTTLAGMGWAGALHPEDRERVVEGWKAAVAAGTPFQSEHRFVNGDGSVVHVVAHSVVERDEVGAPLGRLATVTDATAFREAQARSAALEAELRDSQGVESLGLLAGGLAHDLNNLLAGILGNAELALAGQGPEPPAGMLERIRKAALRATDLTREMLALAGKASVEPQPTELNELVREMVDLLRSYAPRGASVEEDYGDPGAPLMVDATQIRQVVMNLFTNAADALVDGHGSIRVRTGRLEREGARWAFVEVRDTGCGMDEATRARIFDPLFTTKPKGRGLGMSSVLGILRRHGGAVELESAPGQGSTFKVLLPAPRVRAEAEAEAGAEGKAGGCVLVVDDEETARQVARDVLESRGFRVLEAVDGVEALELMAHWGAEVRTVLLDLTMPRMGGADALAGIRRAHPDLPVILCSGYAGDRLPASLGQDPALSFLLKPYRLDALLERVQQAF